MRKITYYWAAYGLIELLTYILLFFWIGFWPLLLIQIASSLFGIFIVKRLWRGIGQNLNEGRTITPYLLDMFCFFLAGILLIIPGVITSIAGLLFFLPFVRTWIKPRLSRWVQQRINQGNFTYFDMK
ncbi:FxsA family protein [Listeria booriae]|uniref:FxsA family protein n=1 Tax=Listeria booriae TaxID=1552123 RepID=A0A7X0YLD7_9LIST|nr:FxsA family protein [Listeria booriae]MBC1371134.1 FxsA family protein [Listeria booriae]MBC1793827.1 FxsA family protein [Listeria booriae]MBC1799854.1 FxsA family protein [Listeria booriae]MBC1804586.1 FxsA family protein [Listeria booriae]MBC1812340.1 FxsA family protein [Listeria booriae]